MSRQELPKSYTWKQHSCTTSDNVLQWRRNGLFEILDRPTQLSVERPCLKIDMCMVFPTVNTLLLQVRYKSKWPLPRWQYWSSLFFLSSFQTVVQVLLWVLPTQLLKRNFSLKILNDKNRNTQKGEKAYLICWFYKNLVIFTQSDKEHDRCHILKAMNPLPSFWSLASNINHSDDQSRWKYFVQHKANNYAWWNKTKTNQHRGTLYQRRLYKENKRHKS